MEITCAIIKWIDSTYYRISDDFVDEIPRLLKPRTLISTGILVNDNEDSITICQDNESLSDGNRLVLTIPKISVLFYEIFTKKIP